MNVTLAEMKDILKMENHQDFIKICENNDDSEIFDFLFKYINDHPDYQLDEFRG